MTASTRYTVDASVLVKLVVEEEHSSNAMKLISRFDKVVLYAPDIIYYEIGSVLFKMTKRKIMDQDYAVLAYRKLLKLPLEITSHQASDKLPDVLDMSNKLGIHFYDCLYIHTTKLTGSTLVSSDQKLLDASNKECDSISLEKI